MRQCLNKLIPQVPLVQSKPFKYFLFILSSLDNVSHNIEKKLKQFIYKHLPDTMIRITYVTKNLKQQFHCKDYHRHLLRNNVVCWLYSSCDSFCIGQTRQNPVKRSDEDHNNVNLGVCNHWQSILNPKVDFKTPYILTTFPYHAI